VLASEAVDESALVPAVLCWSPDDVSAVLCWSPELELPTELVLLSAPLLPVEELLTTVSVELLAAVLAAAVPVSVPLELAVDDDAGRLPVELLEPELEPVLELLRPCTSTPELAVPVELELSTAEEEEEARAVELSTAVELEDGSWA